MTVHVWALLALMLALSGAGAFIHERAVRGVETENALHAARVARSSTADVLESSRAELDASRAEVDGHRAAAEKSRSDADAATERAEAAEARAAAVEQTGRACPAGCRLPWAESAL